MVEKFKTLFFVKSSLISLYLALTFPIPFISSEKLKIFSIITFVFGLLLIINITKDIKLIKSLPTSQGSNIHYFISNKKESFLIPQRVENFERFVSIIEEKTKLNIDKLSYISPLWTYKLLTYLSILMIVGEGIAFII